MKIALAQLNYHIGNFELNTLKIIQAIHEAKKQKADLVVFSELAICGYPPMDLLEKQWFNENVQKAINDIQIQSTDIAVIIGAPSINADKEGKKLYNSAYIIDNGLIKKIVRKTLLPTYDIFDEYRYFESNNEFDTIEIKGVEVGVTICEDLWYDQPVYQAFAKSRLYKHNPLDRLAQLNPAIIINISASPFSYFQENRRLDILRRNARYYGLPIVYVNQVGANTDLIFDGASKVINAEGDVVLQLKSFSEDMQLISFDRIERSSNIEQPINDTIEKIRHALVLGIKDFFEKNGFTKAVIGLSGGLDSAVVAVLAAEALGHKNVTALLMPSQFSSDHSITDAVQLAKNLDIEYLQLPISNVFDQFRKSLHPAFKDLPFGLAEENLQARIRGAMLMAYSNKLGHILLNTSNKSEFAVGYSTMYGDMNGALSVLGDVYKTDVFALAKFLNKGRVVIPTNIITKPPSAELRPDQKDSDSLPEYDLLDKILFNYIEKQLSEFDIVDLGFDAQTVHKVIRLVNISEFKRFQAPPILRVSSKAFGSGRRMPLVAKYD
jgi:NAD+ synthase (glutamine-hydrolysing)